MGKQKWYLQAAPAKTTQMTTNILLSPHLPRATPKQITAAKALTSAKISMAPMAFIFGAAKYQKLSSMGA